MAGNLDILAPESYSPEEVEPIIDAGNDKYLGCVTLDMPPQQGDQNQMNQAEILSSLTLIAHRVRTVL